MYPLKSDICVSGYDITASKMAVKLSDDFPL